MHSLHKIAPHLVQTKFVYVPLRTFRSKNSCVFNVNHVDLIDDIYGRLLN